MTKRAHPAKADLVKRAIAEQTAKYTGYGWTPAEIRKRVVPSLRRGFVIVILHDVDTSSGLAFRKGDLAVAGPGEGSISDLTIAYSFRTKIGTAIPDWAWDYAPAPSKARA